MIKKLTCDVLGLPNYFSILLIIKATGIAIYQIYVGKNDPRTIKKT